MTYEISWPSWRIKISFSLKVGWVHFPWGFDPSVHGGLSIFQKLWPSSFVCYCSSENRRVSGKSAAGGNCGKHKGS